MYGRRPEEAIDRVMRNRRARPIFLYIVQLFRPKELSRTSERLRQALHVLTTIGSQDEA